MAVSLIISLVILGVLLWVVETLIPLDPMIRRLIEVVAVVAVLIYLLRFFAFV
jgi:hypothetical protein